MRHRHELSSLALGFSYATSPFFADWSGLLHTEGKRESITVQTTKGAAYGFPRTPLLGIPLNRGYGSPLTIPSKLDQT